MSQRIPDGWVLTEFGSLIEDGQNGCGARSGDGEPTIVLRLADIASETGKVAQEGLRAIALSASDRAKYALRPGDLLVFRVNGSKDIAGRVVEYAGPIGYTYCDHFIRIRLRRDIILPGFASMALRERAVRRQVETGMVSSAGQNTVSQATLKTVVVPVPPLEEQARIAAKLDAIFAKTRATKERLERLPAMLDALKRSILAAAFRGDLTKAWREAHPDAEGWRTTTLETIVEVQLGQRRAPEYVGEKEFPYIRAANITWRGLDLSDVKTMGFAAPETLLLRPGDVVLNEASGSPTEIGKPALWRGEIENCCLQATVLRLRPRNREVDPEWLYFSCLKDALLGRYVEMAPGIGIVHLTSGKMKKWTVALPSRAEQEVIAQRLREAIEHLSRLADTAATLLRQVESLEQSALAKAFRGELVPQDPNDEPASVLLERIRAGRS